jgi:hypothetical protein
MRTYLIILLFFLCAVPAFGTNYYVSVTSGSDGDDGLSAANAFATLKRADLLTGDGDIIYVEAGTYSTESDSNDAVLWCTDQGSNTNERTWVGCADLNDVNDGGIATLDADVSGLQWAAASAASAGATYNTFTNFHFKGGTTHAFGGGTDDNMAFNNCRFSDSTGNGMLCDKGCTFAACLFDNNGADGLNAGTNTLVTNSVSFSNVVDGMEIDTGVVAGGILAENGDDQIRFTAGSATTGPCLVYDVIIDGNNTDDGIDFDISAVGTVYGVVNCIIYDCVDGIDLPTNTAEIGTIMNNCFYSNTTNVSGGSRGDPDDFLAYVLGNYVATSDPFGGDPGGGGATHNTGVMLDAYGIASNEHPSGAKKAGRDTEVTKDYWDDFIDGTNPPGNSEAPRKNKDIGGSQSSGGGGSVFGGTVVQ